MRFLLLFLLCASPLAACLWDYDTLAQESAGLPDVKAAIVGGFPRNPPLYYEMRLERVTKLIADNPDDLDAYDAAGVACDRLGRHDEAIEWMARKQEAMQRMAYEPGAQPNHRYRYLANLGTFHAHRWFKNGADRSDMADMERGRELIAQAIEENPNAHFGREKYQLRFTDWLIAGPQYIEDEEEASALGQPAYWVPNVLGIEDAMAVRDNDDLEEMGLGDAIEGLAGLITMGAAWESIDAYYALALALQVDGKSAFAHFAALRVQELIEQGGQSIVANLPETAFDPDDLAGIGYNLSKDTEATKAEFDSLRKQADAWHDKRTAYMLAAMGEGRHPDTHTEFWAGFDGDPERVGGPESSWFARARDYVLTMYRDGTLVLIALALLLLAFAVLMVKLVRRGIHGTTPSSSVKSGP